MTTTERAYLNACEDLNKVQAEAIVLLKARIKELDRQIAEGKTNG